MPEGAVCAYGDRNPAPARAGCPRPDCTRPRIPADRLKPARSPVPQARDCIWSPQGRGTRERRAAVRADSG